MPWLWKPLLLHLGCLHTSSSGFGCSESVCLAEKSIPGSPVKGKKPSFDWTDLHAPLKVLSNTRCEFALLKCDAARLTLQISKTKQPTLASFLPTKVGNTWMTGRNHHSCYWMILVSFHSLATHEHCSCNLTSLRGSDTVKRPHFSRDQIQDYPLVPRRPQ